MSETLILDFQNRCWDTFLFQKFSNPYFIEIQDFLRAYLYHDSFLTRTSGSTGIPREVRLSKEAAKVSARISNAYFQIGKESVLLSCLPISSIAAKMLLIRAIEAEAKVLLTIPGLDFYKFIPDQEIDFVSLSPLHVQRILNSSSSFFHRTKKCLIGGSSVTASLESLIEGQKFNTTFYESYGMTETYSHIAVRNISAEESCFTVMEGYQIAIDEKDCLQIFHPEILSSPIQSNDMVQILKENQFRYLGRKDYVFNFNGVKVPAEELEEKLRISMPLEFILSMNDRNEVMLVLSSRPSKSQLAEIQRNLMESNLPAYQKPVAILVSNSWAWTETMKPRREKILESTFEVKLST